MRKIFAKQSRAGTLVSGLHEIKFPKNKVPPGTPINGQRFLGEPEPERSALFAAKQTEPEKGKPNYVRLGLREF